MAGNLCSTGLQIVDHTQESVPLMDPFHVVQLAGQKLTACRQRLQQHIHGHRGRKKDLLYQGRRTLLTRRSLLNKGAQTGWSGCGPSTTITSLWR